MTTILIWAAISKLRHKSERALRRLLVD